MGDRWVYFEGFFAKIGMKFEDGEMGRRLICEVGNDHTSLLKIILVRNRLSAD